MHTSEYPPVAIELAAVAPVQPAAPSAPQFGAKRALWIVASYILTQLGIAGALGGVFAVLQQKSSVARVMLIAVVAALAGCAIAWRMARRSFSGEPAHAFEDVLGVRPATQRQLRLAVAVGFVLPVFNSLLLIRIFPPSSTQELGPLVAAMAEGGWTRHVCAFFAICIAPPTEEFIFRGVLFAGLARRLSVPFAALISVVTFVGMHVNSASPYWPALVAVALLAVSAQIARIRSGSLVPGIAMHTVYNALLFAFAYL
ncbi:MAG TPA: CPBP family intramembrane glutamic endopeptidase, partial [Polyangiales bacterium]|nr:CPBP family intramembrane glutamic endopeptidase [Polyangiales bacterium]